MNPYLSEAMKALGELFWVPRNAIESAEYIPDIYYRPTLARLIRIKSYSPPGSIMHDFCYPVLEAWVKQKNGSYEFRTTNQGNNLAAGLRLSDIAKWKEFPFKRHCSEWLVNMTSSGNSPDIRDLKRESQTRQSIKVAYRICIAKVRPWQKEWETLSFYEFMVAVLDSITWHEGLMQLYNNVIEESLASYKHYAEREAQRKAQRERIASLDLNMPLSALRGRFHAIGGIPGFLDQQLEQAAGAEDPVQAQAVAWAPAQNFEDAPEEVEPEIFDDEFDEGFDD